ITPGSRRFDIGPAEIEAGTGVVLVAASLEQVYGLGPVAVHAFTMPVKAPLIGATGIELTITGLFIKLGDACICYLLFAQKRVGQKETANRVVKITAFQELRLGVSNIL